MMLSDDNIQPYTFHFSLALTFLFIIALIYRSHHVYPSVKRWPTPPASAGTG